MCEVSEWIDAQGLEKGRIEEAKEVTRRMFQKGLPVSEIADISNRSEVQIEEWLGLVTT